MRSRPTTRDAGRTPSEFGVLLMRRGDVVPTLVPTANDARSEVLPMAETMKAAVFEGHERIVLEEKPIPSCGPNDAIVKISLTTICGTDVHIWREEYPVEQGRIVGHEPVGTIHRLGEAVSGNEVGERVLVGAITPCGTCFYCQNHNESQCSGHDDDWKMIGGWQLGN